jgi:hypothetical protein
MSYITPSSLLPGDLRSLLEENPIIHVSGQPLVYYENTGKVFHNMEAPPVLNVLVEVINVIEWQIPASTHPHLDPRFIGTYCLMSVRNLENQDEYLLPMRKTTGFAVHLNSQTE